MRFNERIRVAGSLIEDEALADVLKEVLDTAERIGLVVSFFEATTAAAFLVFSRVPADAAIIEVGLGGRLDATNVIERSAVCGIAQLGIDHEAFLLAPEADVPQEPAERIGFEKAGIAKADVPLVTMNYQANVAQAIAAVAEAKRAHWLARGSAWQSVAYRGALYYTDNRGKLKLPLPALPGAHQMENAALAVAMIRHQTALAIPDSALRAAMGWAQWPARLQKLADGPLTEGREVWLDGAHNPAAGPTIAAFLAQFETPVHIITGILANKDARGLLSPLAGRIARLTAVPVPGHACHPPEAIAEIAQDLGIEADTAPDIQTAIAQVRLPVTFFLVSLYLAGEVLRANDQVPD